MGADSYLIVSKSFFPQNTPRANRTTELAKELARQGKSVTVLTPADPKQEAVASDLGIRLVDLGKSRWPAIPIGFRGPLNLVLRGLRRGLQVLFDYPSIELAFRIPRALRSMPKHDVLISIAAPHAVHWGVARAFSVSAKPADVWLADCGDPFMGQENDSFRPAPYFKYLEKAFCRRADAICVPVEGARVAYYPEFREKIHVIPQGFPFADYAHLQQLEPQDDQVVRFAYAGLFIPGRRDPTRFLEYLTSRQKQFEFHVFTKDPGLVEPFSGADPRIVIRRFMPRNSLLEELARMNFLVNFENAGARQTPSKLIDYWLTGRPILSLDSKLTQKDVADQFLAGNYENALEILHPERYEIGRVTRQFDELAEAALRERHG